MLIIVGYFDGAGDYALNDNWESESCSSIYFFQSLNSSVGNNSASNNWNLVAQINPPCH
jgi:hypothetical protein